LIFFLEVIYGEQLPFVGFDIYNLEPLQGLMFASLLCEVNSELKCVPMKNSQKTELAKPRLESIMLSIIIMGIIASQKHLRIVPE